MRKEAYVQYCVQIDCDGEVQSARLVGPEDRMGFVEKRRCNLLDLRIEPREVNNVSNMSEMFVSCSAARLTIPVHLHLLTDRGNSVPLDRITPTPERNASWSVT